MWAGDFFMPNTERTLRICGIGVLEVSAFLCAGRFSFSFFQKKHNILVVENSVIWRRRGNSLDLFHYQSLNCLTNTSFAVLTSQAPPCE
jgi:hypothetical protein